MFFIFTPVSNTFTPVLVGGAIGLGFGAVGFFTIPVYHDFIVWSYSQPLTWVIGGLGGVALAIATDEI